ncbi:hypothetical protein VNI00_000549 [Paramarasmius palmivorus]|uniref:N-acetyltransferase domain-containing protein n=1 Tax=Paramarasmius palmivorus TaxID=297713 RepID=A0AAW0E5N8_9AGAR
MPTSLLQVDPEVYDTPFLRLPEPHSDVIIAAPRLWDAEPSVEIMLDRAQGWITRVKNASDEVLEAMKINEGVFVDGCPVRHIIKLQDNGGHVFIGDVGISRSYWADIIDTQERQERLDENNARPSGDSNIAWQVGYYLSPAYQGRGIMTAALRLLISGWAIPMMNAHRIRATTFHLNEGSKRVLEKNGFVMVGTIEDYKSIDQEMAALHVLEWRRSGDA